MNNEDGLLNADFLVIKAKSEILGLEVCWHIFQIEPDKQLISLGWSDSYAEVTNLCAKQTEAVGKRTWNTNVVGAENDKL